MLRRILPVSILLTMCLGLLLNAGVADDRFVPLKPFLGKTWKGEFKDSTPEKPIYDVSKWELILNGKAVRIMHSVNNGEYGGESIIIWDDSKKCLVFYYFTTAGFYTNGTITIEDGKMTSHEYVTGNENGITEVKSESKISPDGKLHTKSFYLKDGQWIDGHEISYSEDELAQVIFK